MVSMAITTKCWRCTDGARPGRLEDVCPTCAVEVHLALEDAKEWVQIMRLHGDCPACGRPPFQCTRTCPMSRELSDAHASDERWFREHPSATERVRPVTVAEQWGMFLTSGEVVPDLMRLTRDGEITLRTGERIPTYRVEYLDAP